MQWIVYLILNWLKITFSLWAAFVKILTEVISLELFITNIICTTQVLFTLTIKWKVGLALWCQIVIVASLQVRQKLSLKIKWRNNLKYFFQFFFTKDNKGFHEIVGVVRSNNYSPMPYWTRCKAMVIDLKKSSLDTLS